MKSFEDFKKALRLSESQTGVVNSKGCAGYFQFCPGTYKYIAGLLGFKGTQKDFLNSYAIQEKFLHKLIETNLKTLGNPTPYLESLTNRLGFVVTVSGLVGGMHLGGVGGLQALANKGLDRDDGRTKVSTYIKKFNGYEIPFIKESEFKTSNPYPPPTQNRPEPLTISNNNVSGEILNFISENYLPITIGVAALILVLVLTSKR